MEVGHEIFNLENDAPEDAVNGVVVRAKASIYATTMATQAKVDENRLRRAQVDRMPEILRMVAELEKKLPAFGGGEPVNAGQGGAEARVLTVDLDGVAGGAHEVRPRRQRHALVGIDDDVAQLELFDHLPGGDLLPGAPLPKD
jgi:hypothetical protein